MTTGWRLTSSSTTSGARFTVQVVIIVYVIGVLRVKATRKLSAPPQWVVVCGGHFPDPPLHLTLASPLYHCYPLDPSLDPRLIVQSRGLRALTHNFQRGHIKTSSREGGDQSRSTCPLTYDPYRFKTQHGTPLAHTALERGGFNKKEILQVFTLGLGLKKYYR